MGGVCICLPRNSLRRPSISRRETLALLRSRTLPCTSWVSVTIPKVISALYIFLVSVRRDASFVAFPRHIGSTPAAPGSRVPVWPAFFSPVIRFTLLTAWKDVGPMGFSKFIKPSILSYPQYFFYPIKQRFHRCIHRSSNGIPRGLSVSTAVKRRCDF